MVHISLLPPPLDTLSYLTKGDYFTAHFIPVDPDLADQIALLKS